MATDTQGGGGVIEGGGWLFFSGTILGLAGIMRLLDGFWSLRYHGSLPDNLQDGILGDNLKTYGWLWIAVGVVLILASFLVLTGSELARFVGLFAAAFLGISAIVWMPYYPIWSLTYVAIAILVFYGLAAYGGRTAPD
jgi:hypothetical protein